MGQFDSFADRVSELEDWRQLVADPELERLGAAVENMSTEAKIAAGVADELRRRGITAEGVAERTATKTTAKLEERGFPVASFTWYQKLGGFVAGAILLADAMRGFFS